MEKWILFLKSQKQTADAHTRRGKISLGQGDREVPRVLMCCRPVALSRLTLGSSATTGKLVTHGA